MFPVQEVDTRDVRPFKQSGSVQLCAQPERMMWNKKRLSWNHYFLDVGRWDQIQ